MVEIRFYVPGPHTKLRGSEAGSQKSNAEDEDEDGEEVSATQAFRDAIKDEAEIGQVSGRSGFELRGRYGMDMFLDFMRLRGKAYDKFFIEVS
ncbi:hypothetical protein JVT61DRAFT_1187 [Boletus reticuloceps]|uniref:Uncharacterized protein n=1 Tax=Boletus reticuloceps TaxID=495285 RepID=A0A8I3ACB9_9AGAM|nr:hypothetical protein JVT61DRAFT_1187 [Boletus reticuloceps]